MAQNMVFLGECPVCNWKECVFCCWWVFYKFQLSQLVGSIVQIFCIFYISVYMYCKYSLPILCLLVLSITKRIALKSLICLFLFWPYKFCYMYFDSLLGIYTFKIVRFSWWIIPFDITKCHSLSLIIFIGLKSALPYMNIATSAFFDQC